MLSIQFLEYSKCYMNVMHGLVQGHVEADPSPFQNILDTLCFSESIFDICIWDHLLFLGDKISRFPGNKKLMDIIQPDKDDKILQSHLDFFWQGFLVQSWMKKWVLSQWKSLFFQLLININLFSSRSTPVFVLSFLRQTFFASVSSYLYWSSWCSSNFKKPMLQSHYKGFKKYIHPSPWKGPLLVFWKLGFTTMSVFSTFLFSTGLGKWFLKCLPFPHQQLPWYLLQSWKCALWEL